MIAKKRGENAELAAMAGLLHDLYAYKSGSYDDHAHKGAEYARKVLQDMGITTEEETEKEEPILLTITTGILIQIRLNI